MTGILLLALLALWVWVCGALTRALTRRLSTSIWRWPVGLLAFGTLLVLPVSDEIIGGLQFRALCEANAVFRLGVEKPEGRVTRFLARPANELVKGTVIPIYDTELEYIDVHSGETVLTFHRYVVKGGVLIRSLGISEGNAPLTFGRPSCSPEQARGEAASRTISLSVVN